MKKDWKKSDEMLDEEIDASDIPPLDESFFVNAKLRPPKNEPAQKKSLDTESNPL